MLLRDRFDPRYFEPDVLFRYHAGWAGLDFARASTAWYFDRDGILREVGPDVPRIDWSHGRPALRLEGTRTQKCVRTVNYAVNGLAGWSLIGDPAATLTVVDDPAALAAAGLGIIVGDGKVLKLDNSTGSSAAYAPNAGTVLNDTGVHTLGAYMRGSGAARLILDSQDGDSADVALGGTYARYAQFVTPTAGMRRLLVRANPGAVVYFVLASLTRQGFAPSVQPNPTGSSVTRERDVFTAPWRFDPTTPITVYVRFRPLYQLMTLPGSFWRLWSIGGNSDAEPALGVHFTASGGSFAVIKANNGSADKAQTLAISATPGQEVELLTTIAVAPDRMLSGTLACSVDRGPVTSAGGPLVTAPTEWQNRVLYINGDTLAAHTGFIDLLDALALRGASWTMDQVRAYLPGW